MKLLKDTDREHYLFHCPGCGHCHVVAVNPPLSNGAKWTFDGNMERPTVSPSILCWTDSYEGSPATRCHLFLRNGMIEYLGDCTHHLAGKTVEMEEM